MMAGISAQMGLKTNRDKSKTLQVNNQRLKPNNVFGEPREVRTYLSVRKHC